MTNLLTYKRMLQICEEEIAFGKEDKAIEIHQGDMYYTLQEDKTFTHRIYIEEI